MFKVEKKLFIHSIIYTIDMIHYNKVGDEILKWYHKYYHHKNIDIIRSSILHTKLFIDCSSLPLNIEICIC